LQNTCYLIDLLYTSLAFPIPVKLRERQGKKPCQGQIHQKVYFSLNMRINLPLVLHEAIKNHIAMSKIFVLAEKGS